MKISYNWLKQYLPVEYSPEELAQILINLGLEVESLERWHSVRGGLEGFVIGHVLTCEKHPQADRLHVTTVDVGKSTPLRIVCGAPNVAAGQKVAVALPGAKVYTPKGEFEIQKTKIRGEVSEGMICAEDEMGIGDSHEGILVLDAQAPVGMPAKDYFQVVDDWVFEIGLTPNRIDSASHFGVARDVAAYLKQTANIALKRPDISNFRVDNHDLPFEVIIDNTEACRRYSGIAIKGVTIKESPDWLKNRLAAIGVRPINNVVDVTNYVLHEMGQPLHAFDADKIIGRKVIIRTLPAGTPFVTLDGVTRELADTDLMICNEKEGMCMAGIFGGAESGITDKTQNVFLESANFNPVWIRKSARRHDLHTDSSFRFERGCDPNITVVALKRAAMLIKELAGGTIASEVIDVYPEPIQPRQIKININRINQLIGNNLPKDVIRNILLSLEINILSEDADDMTIEVPTYRVEVTQEADIVEEILRIYGYNRVEISGKTTTTLTYSNPLNPLKEQDNISDMLSSQGFFEIMNNSLTKSAYYESFEEYRNHIVYIVNPLSSDLNCLRQTLIFGALEAIAYNINRKKSNLRFYEFGNCYFLKTSKSSTNPLSKYHEHARLGLFMTGLVEEPNWITPKTNSNIYFLKAYTEQVLRKAGINLDKLKLSSTQHPLFSLAFQYTLMGKTIGVLGIVKKQILQQFDISQEVLAAELDWEQILEWTTRRKVQFKELPKFPEVRRDLSMVLDMQVTYQQLEELAEKVEPLLIKKINLFDVYQGDKIEKGKKSYAISFTLQSEEKTLTDEEIDRVMQKLMEAYEKELGAKIRM
ncbi:MAG TPA: phenylalanine--tRNA ligase subunit beta [Bacteroidales bacterium]|nr:phenylalanine--tRNA ligase subunit beta [Bacteroidales bacterium]HOK98583.1 phenylalanine--tRNA ligase subunit beta [Bacteroidales bacterium]HPO65822.1 phenylalanine--tRNA ligase subunit beta [Bacteroidales bacterium]